MKNYSLKPNESVLYQCNACDNVEVILTNLNLVLIKTTKKLFQKNQIAVDVYPKENIKIYNGVPQIKQKDCSVEIYLTSTEEKIKFLSKRDVHKFVNAVFELLTGKSIATRGAQKIKNAVVLVDNTLGINTVDTVKNVIENGVAGGVLGVLGKTVKKSSKGTNTVNKVLDVTKDILGTTETISNTPQIESKSSADYKEQIETIKKMKDLLDAGVLTQEEFEAKKKEILGL